MKAKSKKAGAATKRRKVPATSGKKTRRAARSQADQADEHWELRLYVAGQTPKSLAAMENLKRMLEGRLPNAYKVHVIDLLANPRLAKEDEIVAIPTLVRKLPSPVRKIIGDLSDTERTLVGLQLREL